MENITYLDWAIIGITAILFIIGIVRGFLASLISLISTAVSAGVAVYVSKPVTQWVYTTFLEKSIANKIEEQLPTVTSEALYGNSTAINMAVEKTTEFLEQFGLPADQTEAKIREILTSLSTTDSIAGKLADGVVGPMIFDIARVIIACILFAILVFVFKLIIRLLKGANNIPVIGGINRIAGGLFGIVEGLIFSYAGVHLISNIMTVLDAKTGTTVTFLEESKIAALMLSFKLF